jgi:HPt (histidine-containing phosphotransfer) domain-containing protein
MPRLLPAVQKFTQRLNDQLDAMDNAWNVRDLKELAALAHWLKGAAGTVGYDAFTEPATELEQVVRAGIEDQIPLKIGHLRRLQKRIVVPGAAADSAMIRARH